ncbi:DUF6361 family protein [Archangium sp.]|uniref:DUF6361 family protein n=1 Tax=Archangium sp. TaxID=1872627 RepID=UPI002D4EA029|nr:DUF6361 family protein [Archangium sp.]HYO54264.1 DUF6361 family protein [Archangium sp.]
MAGFSELATGQAGRHKSRVFSIPPKGAGDFEPIRLESGPILPLRSNIAWLDFRPEDMRSARTLIRELQEEGLLDELGFGVLQNAIADRLYPATSTIMTASRYLFFLPAIYEHLENKRTPSRDIEEAARAKQNQLRDVLKISSSARDASTAATASSSARTSRGTGRCRGWAR